MQERRTEVRMLCADMVEVTWRDHAGKWSSVTGLLEDISASGACLQLDTAAPLGAEIRWKSQENEFTGRVRYCLYREIGYFVGVEFMSGSKWSESSFRPQHLLDLQKFMA
jgi:hypothetical protein